MRAEQQEGEEVRWNARGLGPPPSRYNVLRMLRERRAPNQLLVEERGGKKRRKKKGEEGNHSLQHTGSISLLSRRPSPSFTVKP